MSVKRVVLAVLTAIAVAKMALDLGSSLAQPQVQARLQLYQTDLTLHITELTAERFEPIEPRQLETAREALLGDDPYQAALQQYRQVRETVASQRSSLQARSRVAAEAAEEASASPARQQLREAKRRLTELDLKMELLQAQRGNVEAAQQTWREAAQAASDGDRARTARLLAGLWQQPPQVPANAEATLKANLDGWFRYRSLRQLYRLQARPQALQSLQARERARAKGAAVKLALVALVPGVGSLIGIGLLVFVLVQRALRGSDSLLAANSSVRWETPWDWETTWQVLVVGFFAIGQILLPLAFGLSGFNPSGLDVRGKALYVLASYGLMAAGGFYVLYRFLKPYLPLPAGWFRLRLRDSWLAWGLGGYAVALPLVLLVSALNQQIWQGQGGSNPILFLALQAQDPLALGIFFVTAAVAAPAFEEAIFRGFLLPSLTRYMPVWGAIIASSLLFSIAHLTPSEVLPLAALGLILGVVYTRSRNLLAPILLHGLWNSGTLVSLYVLGSGA